MKTLSLLRRLLLTMMILIGGPFAQASETTTVVIPSLHQYLHGSVPLLLGEFLAPLPIDLETRVESITLELEVKTFSSIMICTRTTLAPNCDQRLLPSAESIWVKFSLEDQSAVQDLSFLARGIVIVKQMELHLYSIDEQYR